MSIASCRAPEAFIALVKRAELQQAMAEIEHGATIAGTDGKITAKTFGGLLARAKLLMHLGKAEQRFMRAG